MGHIAEDVKLSQALLAQSSVLGHEDRTLLEDNLDCLKERLGALGCALGQRCDHMRSRTHEFTAYQVALVILLGHDWNILWNICNFYLIQKLFISMFSPRFPPIQTELQLLQTSLIETKCQILQALAGAMDRPASKQLEVGSPSLTTLQAHIVAGC